ncbi:MAG: DUF3604 domain-containing protein [Candidatus Latescibacterota bacterium]|nr:DUF3604 domain-containing protein [Candidatus Latescibacterota bacterium]
MGKAHGEMFGWAEIYPEGRVQAGSLATYTLTYHVGEYGIDDGGTLKVAMRFASDWGKPQFDDPTAPDYCTVTTDGPGRITCRYDPKGYIRPYQKCLVIDVAEWALSKGDIITIVYGDRKQGSPGTSVQTFREYTFEFCVALDAFGTGQFVELERQPEIEIVPASAAKLVLVAPTQAEVGEQFSLGVKLEDEWGNPATGFTGAVTVEHADGVEGLPATLEFTADMEGTTRVDGLCIRREGLHRVSADTDGLSGVSNPIECVIEREAVRPFWGDLHGQSEETVGTNSVEDYFRFARDVSFLDFVGHQGNDFQITPEFWERIGRCAREFYEPRRFVVFPGYEWSATTPAGGDRNVYFLNEGETIFRTSHWQVAQRADETNDRYPVAELFAELRQGGPAMVVPHIGGRPANLTFHDPDLEPVIEIYSAWGQFEWLLHEAIERGYRVGFCAGSDDHKGRPGASYPGSSSFGVYGGLTCVLAEELTRESIWDALRARRCYATTGQRIILDVRAQDGCHRVGEAFAIEPSEAVSLDISACGTGQIEEVIVYRGLECIHRHPEVAERDPFRLRVVWSGARIKGRDRIAQWDGRLELTGVTLEAVAEYAFDSAAEGVLEQGSNCVAWQSVTSGDEDGLILTLAGSPSGRLSFRSKITDFDIDLEQLQREAYVHDAGGVGLQVRVEYLPVGLQSRECRFQVVDESPVDGTHPYYVRLTQADGARAWSSPFYVTRKSP